jgi:RimJ/RimL family protein N-acetyltransferase
VSTAGEDERLGTPVPGWSGAAAPGRVVLPGRHVTLEPLDAARHGAALRRALHDPRDPTLWDYLPRGPFDGDDAGWAAWLQWCEASSDPLFYVLADPASGAPRGMGSYLRIDPASGVIEIGHLAFGAEIQRTPATTEAIYLLARHAFDELGNRRLEWKCNALNARSRAAALRLGFVFEGIFRQALVVKGRNRDTAWFAMLDGDWPALRDAFERWLAPENLDAEGRQRRTLAQLRDD